MIPFVTSYSDLHDNSHYLPLIKGCMHRYTQPEEGKAANQKRSKLQAGDLPMDKTGN
jgi:hypothetical protein